MGPKKIAASAIARAAKAPKSQTVAANGPTAKSLSAKKAADVSIEDITILPSLEGKRPLPAFVLPEAIAANRAVFFEKVFDWYCARNGHQSTTASASPSAEEPKTGLSENPTATTNNNLVIPWRLAPHNTDPYAIWVSEVMSQQTQIATVVRYWRSWMATFPTVEALAAADGAAVRAVWAGMGYYRRADFLHQGAKFIVEQYRPRVAAEQQQQQQQKLPTTVKPEEGGVKCEEKKEQCDDEEEERRRAALFPTRYEQWVKEVPGVGPYTAAAITSLCYGAPATAVDGNVMRLISRLCGARGVDPKDPKHLALLQGVLNEGLVPPKAKTAAAKTKAKGKEASIAEAEAPQQQDKLPLPFLAHCLPPERRGRVNEGLMEIGASVCRPNAAPLCGECPFSQRVGGGTTSSDGGNSNSNGPYWCRAFEMLQNGDIEAIDGVIPMRGTAATVRAASVQTFVVFVRDETAKGKKGTTGAAASSGDENGGADADTTKVARLRSALSPSAAGHDGVRVLCVTRPKGGLLSEMTDFPSSSADEGGSASATKGKAKASSTTSKKGGGSGSGSGPRRVGDFVHVFSHIRMTVEVFAAVVPSEEAGRALLNSTAAAGGLTPAKGGVSSEETVFAVPLVALASHPVSQLALKSLQCALPALWEEEGALSAGDARLLAHDLCNRRVAGQKAPREQT